MRLWERSVRRHISLFLQVDANGQNLMRSKLVFTPGCAGARLTYLAKSINGHGMERWPFQGPVFIGVVQKVF